MKQEVQTKLEEEISFSEIFELILTNLKIIAISTIATTILAVIYAMSLPPIYKANAVITKAENNSGQSLSAGMLSRFGGIAEIAGISMPSTNNDTATAILNSRDFKKNFIKKNDLLKVIFNNDWDESSNSWIDKEPSYWSAVNAFNSSVSIATDSDGLVNITVEWNDPKIAADWANKMVIAINDRLRMDSIQESQKSLEYLQSEISKTSNTRSQAILSSLMQEHTEKIMLANVRQEFAFKFIDPAVVPEEKSGPSRRGITLMGLIIGVIAPIVFILIRSFFLNEKI